MVRRGPAERLAAWAVTGPLGHLWSVVADVTVLLARYGLYRARTLRGAGSPPSARR
jgi:hypothetical protein